MPKRKAGVNDIIYELDNDDIEISSEDEPNEGKINRLSEEIKHKEEKIAFEVSECILKKDAINISKENIEKPLSEVHNHNGGKSSPDGILSQDIINLSEKDTNNQDVIDSVLKISSDGSKTTIFNEDIVIDSPASISGRGVVGSENRTPLVTVKFRDKRLAATYKNQLKTFMLNLIKLHDQDNADVETETDIELDIWPEDVDSYDYKESTKVEGEDNLFFIDTAPCSGTSNDIPRYEQVSTLISNAPQKEPTPPPMRRPPVCFNCDGLHPLRECKKPKNQSRIADKRRAMAKLGRYHVEDEQKYGHLIPGRISGSLRHALGLKRYELPVHIYRMRQLGYPPGWLEEARISHSGITMFDSKGAAIQDPEEECGDICELGNKDKFDIKKILDYPGFNVPASSRYREEAHLFGLPPMSEQDSKIKMLQVLAPNAMKAYKRKKLTLFPSASNNVNTGEIAEMDLDSGDEVAEFPSVPPLPDEAPPPPPPPPPPPESPLSPPQSPPVASTSALGSDTAPVPASSVPAAPGDDDDLQVIEVTKVKDIPVPEPELITVDDDDEEAQSSMTENTQRSMSTSPTLDDLEEKKRLLLSALETQTQETDLSIITINDTFEDSTEKALDKDLILDNNINIDEETPDSSHAVSQENNAPVVKDAVSLTNSSPTSDSKGSVKTTLYGTPVMNIASHYLKLPSEDKFAKDICDIINFENLPNSTGKFKKISSLLKKVKNEVDRIQES